MSTTFAMPHIPEKFPMLVAGDFGTFFTDPTSPVFFINTSFDIDDIKHLKPVREILDVSEVDFDELVQRDLDDFRIRRDIVNYLVDNMGYKFFPPIVVALTQPADDKQSIKEYYPNIKAKVISETNQFEVEFEDAFSIRWYLDSEKNILSLPTLIRWKPEKTHLMAVDGQHRLVALQAVRGLLSSDSLKLFYKAALAHKSKLDNIKVPVTILIFPNCVKNMDKENLALMKQYFGKVDWVPSSRMKVKQVLRNIFVDVNKTARQPSIARTILLDEKDLSAVFSRIVFSSIKDDNPRIYSALLEYNSSINKETQIEKGRAIITTIGIIYKICQYLFKDSSLPDEGSNFRTRLEILDVPEFPSSEEFPKEHIKSTEFSLEQRSISVELFKDKWLHVFKSLLIDFIPYKTLTSAMDEEYKKYKEQIDKGNITSSDYEIFKILFGSNEDRFILENNAKSKINTESVLQLNKLKEKERAIRNSVSSYELFYSLMFQLGFFQSISALIEDGIFSNNYYVKNNELGYIISTINLFIANNPKNSIFDYENPVNNLIFNGKASPENSDLVASLCLLILLNYKSGNSQNVFLKNISIDKEIKGRITIHHMGFLKGKMEKSLLKEFNSTTENRYRISEIQYAKELNEENWKIMDAELEKDRTTYIVENLNKQETQLKKIIEIEK